MDFAERLKQLRSESNLRQEDLATIISMHRATIGKYETNERFPDKETLIALSKFFNVSVDYLLGITDIRLPAEELIKKGTVKVKEPTEIEKISSELSERERQELKNYANYLHTKSKLSDSSKESSATSENTEKKKAN